MLNEVQEFKDYTHFPTYTSTGPRDTAYLCRFTVEAIRDFHGFDRVFTILARYFLFQNGDPYENIDRARRALFAWVSIPDDGGDLNGWEGKFTICFPELHEEFPDLWMRMAVAGTSGISGPSLILYSRIRSWPRQVSTNTSWTNFLTLKQNGGIRYASSISPSFWSIRMPFGRFGLTM